MKFAVAPATLPDGTKIEPGMAIMWSPYVMGRSPKLWTEPLK
jgi:cytochrome P450